MRFRFDWASAARFPTIMVAIASTATSGRHWEARAGSAESKTRSSAPKAAALTPAAMNAVTVVGAPS